MPLIPHHECKNKESKLSLGAVVALRIAQFVWLIILTGIAGNVLEGTIHTIAAQGAQDQDSGSGVAIFAVVLVTLAALYTGVTLFLYYTRTFDRYLFMVLGDGALFLLFGIASALLGWTLAPLNGCSAFDNAAEAQTAADLHTYLGDTIDSGGKHIALLGWAFLKRTNCLQAQTVWGCCIGLAAAFVISDLILLDLWRHNRSSKKGNSYGQGV